MDDGEFFGWFHLRQSHTAAAAAGGRWVCFRPEGDEMRPMTEVGVHTEVDGCARTFRLCLDRRFIDGRTAPFARDITKSFLRWAGPRPPGSQLALVIAHMEAPAFGLQGGTVLFGDGTPAAPKQEDGTGFLAAYLGRRPLANFTESGARVRAINVAGALPHPAACLEPQATPAGALPAEAWLSVEIRA